MIQNCHRSRKEPQSCRTRVNLSRWEVEHITIAKKLSATTSLAVPGYSSTITLVWTKELVDLIHNMITATITKINNRGSF